MLNKIKGETIYFQNVVLNETGTGITNAIGSLSIVDYTGSTVFSGVGTHQSEGTYQHAANSLLWGTGPVNYRWEMFHSSGTNLYVGDNEILMIGTTANPASYVKLGELVTYYPQIVDYQDDTSEFHVEESYKYTNSLLANLGYKTPVDVGPDGLYDQSLRDMNAHFALYRIVQAWEVSRVEGEGDPWYIEFKRNAMDVYNDIKSGKITFRREKSPGDAGISVPQRTVGSSTGVLHNNWDKSYGQSFTGSDYPRTWLVEVTGTGTSGNLFESTFKYSNDDGVSWGTAGTCGYDWHDLGTQVYVRFSLGSSSGTETVVATGDKWSFETQPIKGQKGGLGMKSYF